MCKFWQKQGTHLKTSTLLMLPVPHCVLSVPNASVCVMHQNPGNVDLQRVLWFPWDPIFQHIVHHACFWSDFLGAASQCGGGCECYAVQQAWLITRPGLWGKVYIARHIVRKSVRRRKTRKTGKKWFWSQIYPPLSTWSPWCRHISFCDLLNEKSKACVKYKDYSFW